MIERVAVAPSTTRSMDATLAASKEAAAAFRKLAPNYVANDGLTLQRATPLHVRKGMISSLHDWSSERWGNTTLRHVQSLMKLDPYALASVGGNHSRLPVYYAYNCDANLDVKYYMVNQMVKKFDYPSKKHVEEKAMAQHLHDHFGWKATTPECIKKLIHDTYVADEKCNALLEEGGAKNCTPLKYAVENDATKRTINCIIKETVIRHKEIMKSEEDVLEKTIMIKNLWESKYKSGWPHTTVRHVRNLMRQNTGSLLLPGGKAKRLPLYYAVKHRCKTNVKEFILTEMVSSGKFKTKYAAMETIMIEDLWDSFGWRETSIDRVKNLVMYNKMGLIVDRHGNEGSHECMLPIYFAVSGGAKLDVVEWICEQMGVEKVNKLREPYSLGTLLHSAIRGNHSHLVPYLLSIHPKSCNIRDIRGNFPADYAIENNATKIVEMLSAPEKTISSYEQYSRKRVGYSPIERRGDGKFFLRGDGQA